jgi:hypothetical protein
MAEAPTVTRAFAEEQVDFLMGEGCVLTNEQYKTALATDEITNEGQLAWPRRGHGMSEETHDLVPEHTPRGAITRAAQPQEVVESAPLPVRARTEPPASACRPRW